MQSGGPIDIPLTVNLHIEKFAGGNVTEYESGCTNIIFDQYADGRWYATQRPGVNQVEDASATVSDARGRGCYYWDAVTDKYIVNNNKVYKGSYSGTSMTISAGTQRVFIESIGNYLVIIDQENDEGWYINSAAPTTINAIADVDFPSNLARGGAVLNDKLYVLTTTGDIYESDVRDPTSWGALNFRNSEIEPDAGVALDKHKEHIIVLGTRSLEFFQDTANPTGSTLTPRTDISYDIGTINEDAFWRAGDTFYFVGQDRSNALGVFALDNFGLVPISPDDMGTFLTSAVHKDGIGITCCSYTAGQREFLALTLHFTPSDISPVESLVYSAKRGWWGFWCVETPDVNCWPVVAWMPSDTTRDGEGILANGDLVGLQDDFNPVDTVDAQSVYEADVYVDGVYTAIAASGTAFDIDIRTGVISGNTPRRKRMGDLWSIHTPTTNANTLTIAFADEQNTTFVDHDSIDISDSEDRINRCGSFRRRNIRVHGTLDEQWQGEKLQATVRAG